MKIPRHTLGRIIKVRSFRAPIVFFVALSKEILFEFEKKIYTNVGKNGGIRDILQDLSKDR